MTDKTIYTVTNEHTREVHTLTRKRDAGRLYRKLEREGYLVTGATWRGISRLDQKPIPDWVINPS